MGADDALVGEAVQGRAVQEKGAPAGGRHQKQKRTSQARMASARSTLEISDGNKSVRVNQMSEIYGRFRVETKC